MTVARSDIEIIRDRLARLAKHGAAYVETHARLVEEVAAKTTLVLNRAAPDGSVTHTVMSAVAVVAFAIGAPLGAETIRSLFS